jgi:transposase
MARYRHYDSQQTKLIAVDYGRQLVPGTFEHALSYLIDNEIDLSRFAARFNNDQTGAPAYDPAVLLKVVLFAYSRGITSSRTMAQACTENVVFIALACDQQPHFTTLAHFVATLGQEVEAVFRQVLLVCDAQGLIGKQMFAIDGCKLPSNASKEWSGTRTDFARKAAKMERAVAFLVSAHAAQDANDALSPNEASQREHEERTLATLRKNALKLRTALAQTPERTGAKGRPIKQNLTDPDSATLKGSHGVVQGYIGVAAVDAEHQVIVDAQAHGVPQEHDLLKPVIDATRGHLSAIGVSPAELASAVFLADAGYHSERGLEALAHEAIDGYIADGQMRKRDPRYAEAAAHKPASKAKTFQPKDFRFDPEQRTCVCPGQQRLKLNSANALISGRRAMVFIGTPATCAACPLRKRCLRKPDSTAVRQVAFFHGVVESKLPNPHCRAMRTKIDSAEGRALYAQRMGLIEPVFGHTLQRGLRRFTLRGRDKVDTQWKLFCIVHNVAKLQRYGNLPTR